MCCLQDLRLKLEDAREMIEMLREQLRRERERHAQTQAQLRLLSQTQQQQQILLPEASAAAPSSSLQAAAAALQHSSSGSDSESRVGVKLVPGASAGTGPGHIEGPTSAAVTASGNNGLPSRTSAECSKCPNRSDHCIYKQERDSLVVELEAARSQVS